METQYSDKAGIKHDVRILMSYHKGKLFFIVDLDGDHFCDFTQDEDRWIELFSGSSERSTEYGSLIDKLSVFVDRKFETTLYDVRDGK